MAKSPLPLLNDEPVRARPNTARAASALQIARIERRVGGDDDHAGAVAVIVLVPAGRLPVGRG